MATKGGHDDNRTLTFEELENGIRGVPPVSCPIPIERSSPRFTSAFQPGYLACPQMSRVGDSQNQSDDNTRGTNYGMETQNTRSSVKDMPASHVSDNNRNIAPFNTKWHGYGNIGNTILPVNAGSIPSGDLSTRDSSQIQDYSARIANIEKYIIHAINRICGLLCPPQIDEERRMSVIRKIKRLCDSLPYRLDLICMINDTLVGLSSTESTSSRELSYENSSTLALLRIGTSNNEIYVNHTDAHSKPIYLPWPPLATDSLECRYKLDDVNIDYMLKDVISSLNGKDVRNDISRYDTEYKCTYNHNPIQPHWSSRSRILAEGFDICSVFVNAEYEKKILHELSDRTSHASHTEVKTDNISCDPRDTDFCIVLDGNIHTSVSTEYHDSSESMSSLSVRVGHDSHGKSKLITSGMMCEFLVSFFREAQGMIEDRNPLYTGLVKVTVNKKAVRALCISLSKIGILVINALVQQLRYINSGTGDSRQDESMTKQPMSVLSSEVGMLDVHTIFDSAKMCHFRPPYRNLCRTITANHILCILQRCRLRQTKFNKCPYSGKDNTLDSIPVFTIFRFLELCEERIVNLLTTKFHTSWEEKHNELHTDFRY